jgi:hypothetical protein
LEIRRKGKRTSASMSYDAIHEFGWKILARETAQEKKAKRRR